MKEPLFYKAAMSRAEAALDRCMMHTAGLTQIVTVIDDRGCLTFGSGVPYQPNLPLQLLR